MLWINNLTVMLSCIFIIFTPNTKAENITLGTKRINIQGSIVDSACTIAPGEEEQTVDMAAPPVDDIIIHDQGYSNDFEIKLVNCEQENPERLSLAWQYFQLTFDGDTEGELFGVRGTASGVALQLNDAVGNVIRPGEPLRLDGMNQRYSIKLVANDPIFLAGEYFSSVRYKLDYF